MGDFCGVPRKLNIYDDADAVDAIFDKPTPTELIPTEPSECISYIPYIDYATFLACTTMGAASASSDEDINAVTSKKLWTKQPSTRRCKTSWTPQGAARPRRFHCPSLPRN